jgi:hypothetical protein
MKKISLTILIACFLVSCADKSKKNTAVVGDESAIILPAAAPKEPLVFTDPEPQYPVQAPSNQEPGTLEVQLYDESYGSFNEPMTFVFEKDSGMLRGLDYVLTKIYLGPEDNRRFLGIGQMDDIDFQIPWKYISTDLETYYIYGGHSIGKGEAIGYLRKQNGTYFFDLASEYKIDLEKNLITIFQPENEIKVPVTTCPSTVKSMGDMACRTYITLYNTILSIDFGTLGEVAPKIPPELLTAGNIIDLVKAKLTYKPSLKAIRDEILIPLVVTIYKLKRLNHFEGSRLDYVNVAAEVYAEAIITALEATIKIHSTAPELVLAMAPTLTIFAVIASSSNESDTGFNQSKDYKNNIEPTIQNITSLLLDVIFNGSKTPLNYRLELLVDSAENINSVVEHLCRKDRSDECEEVETYISQ